MYLKRVFGPPANAGGPPVLTGVKVLRAKARQHFTQHFLDGALAEGWLTFSKGRIELATDPPLVYVVVRTPGSYCCHCEAAIPDANIVLHDVKRTIGQQHVLEKHGTTSSPDPCNPAGYRTENHYTAVLQGPDVEALSAEEAVAFDRQVRTALREQLRAKYGDSRGKAEQRRAAKAAARKEG